MVEPPFRTITNRIILENLSNLIIKKTNLNFIDRNHQDVINKIYYSYLSNIKLIILNNKFIRETGFEKFESEWRNYKQPMSAIVEELISKPYLLIPFNLEDIIEGKDLFNQDYPKILRIQKTEVDNFRNHLIIFMTLHDLRCDIYKENDYIKNSFPLRIGGCELETGMSYDISSKSNFKTRFKNRNFPMQIKNKPEQKFYELHNDDLPKPSSLRSA
jgi:hypothetical protein